MSAEESFFVIAERNMLLGGLMEIDDLPVGTWRVTVHPDGTVERRRDAINRRTEHEHDDEDIHTMFSLTYANYLVLHRTLMQSMPLEWQHRMVRCIRELEWAFWHVPQPAGFRVNAVDEHGRFTKDPVPHYNRGRAHVEPRIDAVEQGDARG